VEGKPHTPYIIIACINATINDNNTPKVCKLTQAGYNGDTFLEKDIFHCRRKHGVQARNFVKRSWNFVVIIMACKDKAQ
jgi:hypothetical protein